MNWRVNSRSILRSPSSSFIDVAVESESDLRAEKRKELIW
jgi:hypothetical protein